MKTLIISDIHANITALDAVLKDAEPFERVWCLGDVVGYGPDPNACVEKVMTLPGLHCVKGNHDAAITGDISLDAFNYEARTSLEWLESKITPENKHWLAGLGERIQVDGVTLVHGSPRRPIWEYVMDQVTARQNMMEFDTQICLVGHTHIPSVFQMEGEEIKSTRVVFAQPDDPFELPYKSIVNPGSVGQPRDHNPKASYMIYDDVQALWTYHRVGYDVEKVQKKIRSAGLPYRHASRLEDGW